MKEYDYVKAHINKINKKELFSKSPISEMWKILSVREYAISIRLSQFITKEDGVLRNDGKIINLKDMSTLLEIDYDSIRRTIPELEKKGIIAKIEIDSDISKGKYKNCYVVNPYVYLITDYISKNNLDLFIDTIWAKKYDVEITRTSPKYRKWVSDVLNRDKYTCQCCGSTNNLEVHHILNYSQYSDLRLDINNGIVLCECCHSPIVKGSFHNTYGTRNNNAEQLTEYIKLKQLEVG